MADIICAIRAGEGSRAVQNAAIRVARAQNDWRREGNAMLDMWEPCDLPDTVSAALLRYMDHFGLTYGAADFIVTPDHRIQLALSRQFSEIAAVFFERLIRAFGILAGHPLIPPDLL